MIGKRGLVRVIRTPDGKVEVDLTGKRPGRGAYVHPEAVCVDAALRGQRLAHALKVEVSPEVARKLRGDLDHAVARFDLLARMGKSLSNEGKPFGVPERPGVV